MRPTLILLALALAACSSPARVPSRTPPGGITATVVLSSRSMTAGSSMSARVIVENRTGHARRVTGCGTLFQIVLVSGTYRPQVAWLSCLQYFTIRPGRKSYPVTILATYLHCSQSGRPLPGVPKCLSRGMPALPAGHYRAELIQSTRLFPSPPEISVLVTRR